MSGVTATAGTDFLTVSFTAPANDGGTPVTGYTAVADPGGASVTGTTAPLRLTVPRGQTYTVTVTAQNAAGDSAPATSAPVTLEYVHPTLTRSTAALTAGQSLTVRGHGTAGKVLDLFAMTAPDTTYRVVRSLTADGNGNAAFAPLAPMSRFTYQVRERGNPYVSASYVTTVRTALVVTGATRTGLRAYTVRGSARPVRTDQVVTLSWLDSRGAHVLGRVRVASNGTWSIPARFPARATYTLVATTAADSRNSAGTSTRKAVTVS